MEYFLNKSTNQPKEAAMAVINTHNWGSQELWQDELGNVKLYDYEGGIVCYPLGKVRWTEIAGRFAAWCAARDAVEQSGDNIDHLFHWVLFQVGLNDGELFIGDDEQWVRWTIATARKITGGQE